VPQNRERVIFLASKQGVSLPQFPLPSHVFNRRATTKNLANGERLAPVSWAGENTEEHVCLCAPMPAVTIDDFLGDLVSLFTNVQYDPCSHKHV
jgi:DNA (cytosine-5)-methyltransferase 1